MAAKLEEIKNGAFVRGVASAQAVHVVSVDWIGDQAISVVFRDHNGAVAEAILYRDDEHRLEVEHVRRQNIWHNLGRRLAECGPRLGVDVKRRACGVASADIRWSFA